MFSSNKPNNTKGGGGFTSSLFNYFTKSKKELEITYKNIQKRKNTKKQFENLAKSLDIGKLEQESKENKKKFSALFDLLTTSKEEKETKKETKEEKKKKRSPLETLTLNLYEMFINLMLDLMVLKALRWISDPVNKKKLEDTFTGLMNFSKAIINVFSSIGRLFSKKDEERLKKNVDTNIEKVKKVSNKLESVNKELENTDKKVDEIKLEKIEKPKEEKTSLNPFEKFVTSLETFSKKTDESFKFEKTTESLASLDSTIKNTDFSLKDSDKTLDKIKLDPSQFKLDDLETQESKIQDNINSELEAGINSSTIKDTEKGLDTLEDYKNNKTTTQQEKINPEDIKIPENIKNISNKNFDKKTDNKNKDEILVASSDLTGLLDNKKSKFSYDKDPKMEEAFKNLYQGKSYKNVKPLKSEVSKNASSESSEDLKKIFELPIKAVGSSLIALTLNSVGNIPGSSNIIAPLLENISSTFKVPYGNLLKSGFTDSTNKNVMQTLVDVVSGLAGGKGIAVGIDLGGMFSGNSGSSGVSGESSTETDIGTGTSFTGNAPLSGDQKVRSIIETANALKLDPLEIASIIARESSFDPTKTNGIHFGLWQANPNAQREAKRFLGIDQSIDWRTVPFDLQMKALVNYAIKARFKPGEMNHINLYASLLAGNPRALNSSDGNVSANTALIRPGEAKWKEGEDFMRDNGYAPLQKKNKKMKGGLVKSDIKYGDHSPHLLEDGEYVLNKNATDFLGLPFLDFINETIANRFAILKPPKEAIKDLTKKFSVDNTQSYKYEEQTSSQSKNTIITLPEKVNNSIRNSSETFSSRSLGKTKDESILTFSRMIEEYV